MYVLSKTGDERMMQGRKLQQDADGGSVVGAALVRQALRFTNLLRLRLTVSTDTGCV